MKRSRIFALFLTLAIALSLLPASAAEPDWLIPKLQDYRTFTDTAGTICEEAAATCCQAGLMDGVDNRHFLPTNGLSSAQIIVISARLHRLLSGETLEYFEPISLKGPDWWTPYDGYLREQISELAEDETYQSLREFPVYPCDRYEFLHLLSAVLADTGTTLSELNDVDAVPDCCDQELIQFYRWGILGGKDQYGTLYGSNSLSRAAAAAMLARLIDPAQRLTLDLRLLDLCRDLLGGEPETVILTIGGQDITLEQFAPTMVSVCSGYNHSHFGSMGLEMSGRTTVDEAVDTLRKYVRAETLGPELGLEMQELDGTFAEGYRGLTAAGQTWTEEHMRLENSIIQTLGAFPMEDLPEVAYAPAWDTLNLTDLSTRVAQLPFWGGTF